MRSTLARCMHADAACPALPRRVTFRVVVFRPFQEELLVGKVHKMTRRVAALLGDGAAVEGGRPPSLSCMLRTVLGRPDSTSRESTCLQCRDRCPEPAPLPRRRDGLHIDLGFFKDAIIPPHGLPEPSFWHEEDEVRACWLGGGRIGSVGPRLQA